MTHVPGTVDPSVPVPLVVDLHGFTSMKEYQKSYSKFYEMSSREKFIVAWPDGLHTKWDFGCDTGFLRTVVSCTAAKYNIDPRRVYFTGDWLLAVVDPS